MKKIKIRLSLLGYCEKVPYYLYCTEDQIRFLDWLIEKELFEGEYEKIEETEIMDLTN